MTLKSFVAVVTGASRGAGRGIAIPDVVTGKAVFGIDVKVPGMVYATLMQAPVRCLACRASGRSSSSIRRTPKAPPPFRVQLRS